MNRLLIVEDDTDLREGLTFAFEMDGYEVTGAGNKYEGQTLARQSGWDLVLLDCNLPDGNGFDFLAELRAFSETPVFMLTARNTEMDEVKALELGIADFMSKPFSLAVLKARVRRILSQARPAVSIISGGVCLNKDTCAVTCDGVAVDLSKVEYQLLLYLLENRGQVLTKEQILAYVWDARGNFVDENTLSVTIRRLRTKIEKGAKHPTHIQTVHGVGYIWKEGQG